MATFLQGEEQDAFVDQIRPLFHNFKKSGNTRQVTAMEKMLEQHSSGELKPDVSIYGQIRPVAPAPGITQDPEQSSKVDHPMANGVTANGDAPRV